MTLNKPRYIKGVTPAGKKMTVYVENERTGNVNEIHFGDSSMSDYTHHRNKKRRANFHSRHNCAEKTNKATPGWWSCNYLWKK